MDARFGTIAAIAASQHSVVSLAQLERAGVTKSLRYHWVHAGLLERLGPKSFALAGSDPTCMRSLVAGFSISTVMASSPAGQGRGCRHSTVSAVITSN